MDQGIGRATRAPVFAGRGGVARPRSIPGLPGGPVYGTNSDSAVMAYESALEKKPARKMTTAIVDFEAAAA